VGGDKPTAVLKWAQAFKFKAMRDDDFERSGTPKIESGQND